MARSLLGCYLVRQIDHLTLVGRIVETEAYLGFQDPCCHSFKGLPTKRTEAMFLPGGHSYVYFIYGMYYCFNVVTQQKAPEAVLIRALEPIEGIREMRKRRGCEKIKNLCSGPGKLCEAMGITKTLNAKKLSEKKEIYILKDHKRIQKIQTDRRVGLPIHEDAAYWPLRFYVTDNPFVSVHWVK